MGKGLGKSARSTDLMSLRPCKRLTLCNPSIPIGNRRQGWRISWKLMAQLTSHTEQQTKQSKETAVLGSGGADLQSSTQEERQAPTIE